MTHLIDDIHFRFSNYDVIDWLKRQFFMFVCPYRPPNRWIEWNETWHGWSLGTEIGGVNISPSQIRPYNIIFMHIRNIILYYCRCRNLFRRNSHNTSDSLSGVNSARAQASCHGMCMMSCWCHASYFTITLHYFLLYYTKKIEYFRFHV